MQPDDPATGSLTVSEANILGHLQRGAPDAEIAVRLGLPIREAKSRIAALMQRLGFESRNGLEAWDGVVPPRFEPAGAEAEAVPTILVAAPKVPAGPRNYARLIPLAVCALLVAAGVAYLATAGRGSSPALAPSPALRTIDQLGAPAAYIDGVALPELRIGAATALPADLALIQWDTGTGVVRRIYRSQDGITRIEDLFAPPRGGTVTQVAATPDGREMVIAVSAPRGGGLTPTVSVSRSNDGGATWTNLGASSEGAFVTALGPTKVVMALDSADGSRRVELLPGRITVRSSAQLIEANVPWTVIGTAIQQASTPAITRYASSAPFNEGARYAVRLRGPGADGAVGVGVADDQGSLLSGFAGNVRTVVNVVPGGLIAADIAIPSTSAERDGEEVLLALINPETGVAHPIDSGTASRREQVLTVAVQRGPLVHIGGSDGGCAPVRDRPVVDSVVLYCASEGMALRSGETRVHNDYTWVRVMTDRERPGWVDLSYVTP